MPADDRDHLIIEYMCKKLDELKEIVGPLENLDGSPKNELELVMEAPLFHVKETCKGNITTVKLYNLEYTNDFYRSYIILHLIHEILGSEHGKVEWARFKDDTIIGSLYTEFKIWENSGPINNLMKDLVYIYSTFKTNEATREHIEPTYDLRGHVNISNR